VASRPALGRVDIMRLAGARLLGMALLALIVLAHNHFVLPGSSQQWSVVVGAVLIGYAVLAGAVLRLMATHPAVRVVVDVLWTLDLVLWAFAIYGTGGERSSLVFLMILRTVDQSLFGVRRALIYAHLSIAAYAALVVYLIAIEGRPLVAGAEACKVAIVWAANLYVVFMVALNIERIRRRRREAEEALRQREREILELRIEIDEAQKARHVSEITETDYFHALQQKARALRQRPTV